MNNEQLLKRIEQLEREIQSLKTSQSIPFDIDRAFEGRGFLKYIEFEEIDPLDFDTLNTLVPTPSGDFPVIAFPIRWMKIKNSLPGNKNYIIPAYTADNPLP